MNTDLVALIANPPSGRNRPIVLDCHDYAQAVILQGREVPWHEPMVYANFVGQVQALLSPDVALLALDRFYAARLAGAPGLRAAMGVRSRTGFALRTLLADPETTAKAVELVTVFTRTQRQPVVLHIPSPRSWLANTHSYAEDGGTGTLEVDDAENASLYMADWLRNFSSLPLAGVLFDDRDVPGALETEAVELVVYSPVANVTEHYGWSLGMRRNEGVELWQSNLTSAVLPEEFWLGQQLQVPVGDFLFGEIPSGAVPEQVLGRLAAMNEVLEPAHG